MLQRINPVLRVLQRVDCSRNRRADLTMDQEFDEQGLSVNVQWDSPDVGQALISAVCIAQA